VLASFRVHDTPILAGIVHEVKIASLQKNNCNKTSLLKRKNMRIKTKLLILSLFTSAVFVGNAQNPIIQTKYTADPAPLVYKDTVFLYTSHDEDDATGFKMYNWMLYTTTDMVNWTDHGTVASTKSFSWSPQNGAWAPQCIERNGKFYLYCPIHVKGIGVLVLDSPYDPFTDPLGKPLIQNSIDDIDPTVYTDDDEQTYLYWGNPNMCYPMFAYLPYLRG